MFQWSDDYNAQTIFDQVWEAPYSWFVLVKENDPDIYDNHPGSCLGIVQEYDVDEGPVKTVHITAEMIDKVVIPTYTNWMNLPPGHPRFQSFTHWLDNLDANDVDAILQMAVFGEIVYG